MFQDNPLLAQLKKQIQETLPKKEGYIKATDRGFGFLETDNKESIFIPPVYMKNVMHGDRVIAVLRTEKEREVAEPQELVEQSITRFIGRVKLIRNRLHVIPDHPQLKEAIKARAAKGLNPETLKEGDWVVAELTRHPLAGSNQPFFCEVNEKITDSNDKIAPWWVTLARHQLPNAEPAPQDSWAMLDEGIERQDLTDLPFITIDGESTKDMDDALYTVANDDGSFEITIAIADPTSYIAVGDKMDDEARERGFTIYLPGRNIPMLPRELSDELCSLIENEKRPVLCCRVSIDNTGVIQDDITFFGAWIKSQGRLSYNNVSDFLENGHCDNWTPNAVIEQQIVALQGFAILRSDWRMANAVVFPDRPDYRFELSEDNDVVAIHTDLRRIANRMIEEAMITANICAGRALQEKFATGVFNVHSGFHQEKLDTAMEFITNAEAPFTKEEIVTLEGFSALRRWLNTLDSTYLDNRLRKFQAYSEVANTPAPHYAMGLDVYATWTSPIRKYGDMINHRLLKALITGNEPSQKPDDNVGDEIANHRRHHRMAERDVSDWLYVRLLKDAVKKETIFKAEIFDINRAGMRVRLLENGAAAFIPGSLIVDNKERIVCSGELGIISIDGVKEYQLGDTFDVKLAEVRAATRQLVAKPVQQYPAPKVTPAPEQAADAPEKA
ncbi:exoribonuclease II [Photobacterium phosphoreum]|jgi:exoribonuclease-2|uniref:Exoribonuclease 2 n=1 Tax=Photobacterium phosphoreum TaxID=659 RepID=A0AAW4ZTG0_PHOPO|nr:exoribonuclease II [Photobacterium phosphoreum]MCD9463709.1 exoribonuclease II [Photobacterium phosphoreum]MCD9491488.1 exoribonuclease II [Photobacterium phosphoreum]MCD9506535.1 exoribonuclease II [Photobacterium phosphoreum]MCF2190676.1 exoribonuclease II [Photobacterium phosphoreum]MCF2302397.1 exoribonuclease II [Photobacterium phosphoreum]